MNIAQLQEIIRDYVETNVLTRAWVPGKDWVQYAGPHFSPDEYVAAITSLLGGWLVHGPDCTRFEKEFAARLGKLYGVLTNSGSSANLLMVSALRSKRLWGLPRGTKIITPAAGFPTTLNPILQNEFVPVFVDIELNTLNLDLKELGKVLDKEKDVKVIMFAHVLGNPPNMRHVMDYVNGRKLILLEDCCDAIGTTYAGHPLGGFGEMSSVSFYPAHHITCGEGGYVATRAEIQKDVVKSLGNWGRACNCSGLKANLSEHGVCGRRFSNWIDTMPTKTFDHKYIFSEIGYNLKPIELQASILLQQTKKLVEIKEKRQGNYKRLHSIFKPYESYFILPEPTDKADVSWFAFPLTVKKNAKFDKNSFVTYLEKNKIQTRPYFGGNLLLQPAYEGIMNKSDAINKFPVATRVMFDTFFLGTSPVITSVQLDYIQEIVNKFFKE